MATSTAAVTISNASYTAVTSISTACTLWVYRGQRVRVVVQSGQPAANATNYFVIEGPNYNYDDAMRRHDFTISGADVWVMLENGGTSVIATRT
ncbi:MAG: hypothetical protein KGP14_02380 [Betaproteobacteria bacterium]|nr:hypothetical protein [Betaproteobacteria bacterium]